MRLAIASQSVVAATALAAVLLAVLAGAAAAQVITVEPRSIDLGTMKQHQIKTRHVTITNEGGGLLKIEEVKADCGCTVPTLANDTLAPGETTQVEIQFDSKQFEGNVVKTVQIMSNDPRNRIVDVMITANITTPLLVEPKQRRIGFPRSLRGEALTERATFTATEAAKLELKVDTSKTTDFSAKIVEKLDGNPQAAAVDISIPPDMPSGLRRGNVRVLTNIAEVPYVDIQVQAYVCDLLVTSPEQVNYRFRDDFKQIVRVAPFEKGLTFKVTKAEVDVPGVEVEVLETIPNLETQVRLSGRPIAKDDPRAVAAQGRMLGTLKIHTDLEAAPVIEVPVSYMIRM